MSNQVFELLTLKDIFDGGSRQLSVPDYQRGYSWETEQRADLIGDIEQIGCQQHRHFTGTVVASPQGESSSYDLVDGQQRITSLVLLLSSIVRLSRKRSLIELAGLSIDDVEECYIRSGASTGNTRYQLKLGVVRDPLFHEVLVQGCISHYEIQSKADQNIVDAIGEFDSWLGVLTDEKLGEVLHSITSKLGFLLYAPQQDAEIGLMFEVINNRGKPLRELEKIKNYLIYFAGRNEVVDLIEKVNSSWPVLLQALNAAGYTSNDDENRFLRVCWIVFEDYNKSKSYHVYENLKRLYPASSPNHWGKLCEFVDFVVGCAKTYEHLYCVERSSLTTEERTYLERISLHPGHASVLPLIIALFARESDAIRRAETLDLIEKLNFRYYVSGISNRNDSGQGELFQLAHEFYLEIESFGKVKSLLDDGLKLLQNRLIKFVSTNANDQKFVHSLTLDKDESGDYYRWQGLKFFLGSYEDSLCHEQKQRPKLASYVAARDKKYSNDFYHLEHIWAAKDFTVVKDEVERNINKRRLGNFILLIETLNIKVSNDRPEKKVDGYFGDDKLKPNTKMILELAKDFKSAKRQEDDSKKFKREVARYWYLIYQRFLDIREQRMVNFALSRWRVEGVAKPVEKVTIDSDSRKNEIFRCSPEYGEETNLAE